MLSQKLERGILTKYMTEQPNDQKKPHGVDFSFNYQFSCSLGYDSVQTKLKLRMTLTFSYELLLKHLFLTKQLLESMCFNQEEPSLGQFSNFSEQKKYPYSLSIRMKTNSWLLKVTFSKK